MSAKSTWHLSNKRLVLLACITLAGCFWITQQFSKTYSRVIEFPTGIIYLDTETSKSDTFLLSTIRVKIVQSGMEWAFSKITRDSVFYFKHSELQELNWDLGAIKQRTLGRMSISQSQISELDNLESLLRIQSHRPVRVPISVHIPKSEVPIGYALIKNSISTCDTITLLVPAEKIDTWSEIEIWLKKSQIQPGPNTIQYSLRDFGDNGVIPNRSAIKIDFRTELLTEKSWMTVVQITGDTANHKIIVSPSNVRITVQIPISFYDHDSLNQIQVYCNPHLSDFDTVGSVPLFFRFAPSFVENKRVQPNTVELLWVETQ
jgi:hypothetical protein